MRSPCLSFTFLAAVLAAGLPLRASHPVLAADLVRMRQGGLKESTILDFLHTYQATVRLSEADDLALSQAGLSPGGLQALREYAQVHPLEPPTASEVPGAGEAPMAPIPRFFVGYAHDPAAFPAWYYGPFEADNVTASQLPGRGLVFRGGGHSRTFFGWHRNRRP